MKWLCLLLIACNAGDVITQQEPSSSEAPQTLHTTIYRKPYVTQVSQTSAKITWASSEDAAAEVSYGNDNKRATAVNQKLTKSHTRLSHAEVQHEAVLTDLAPGVQYTYRCYVGGTAVS